MAQPDQGQPDLTEAQDAGMDAADGAGGADSAEPDLAPEDLGADLGAPDADLSPSDMSPGGRFQSEILPLFTQYGCLNCHGEALQLGELRLDSLEAALGTGAHAPVVVPCDSQSSALIDKMGDSPAFGGVMPPEGSGDRVSPEHLALIAAWVDEGADVRSCQDELDAGLDMDEADGDQEPPEVPPSVVEDRVFRVSSLDAVLTERLPVPRNTRAGSALMAPQGASLGVVGFQGEVQELSQSGEWESLPVGWEGDADVGALRSALRLEDGSLLLSTDIGVLYRDEGYLWASPVSDVIGGVVHQMVSQPVEGGEAALWLAAQTGLFRVHEGLIERLRPGQERAGAPVSLLALGPDPELPDQEAVWAAWGSRLYGLQAGQGLMVYALDLALEAPLVALTASPQGELWAATEGAVLRRRQGPLLGVSRWVRWALPQGQVVRQMRADAEGGVWLLTDQALYHSLNGELWGLAQGVPVSDVLGLSQGAQSGAWLGRPGEMVWTSPTPTVAVDGLEAGQQVNLWPDLEVFARPSQGVVAVQARVDDCPVVEASQAPWLLRGAQAWRDCLTPGPHRLLVEVIYEEGAQPGQLELPFLWNQRDEQITWHAHIEPMIHATYCARAVGCHVGQFAPYDYDTWVEKADRIIERVELNEMPPNGARPDALEKLMIRWWREDGFLP